jgi:hypothetical protein
MRPDSYNNNFIKMKKIEIPKKATASLLRDLISEASIRNKQNTSLVFNKLFKSLDEYQISSIITLMLSEEPYKALSLGDYVTVKPPNYHKGDKYEEDILKDLGLLHKSGKVYGHVIGDGSWNGEFDPLSNRIKVHLLYHNADKELEVYEDSFNPFELKRITKNSIKYYKLKKDAKTNTGVDQITL